MNLINGLNEFFRFIASGSEIRIKSEPSQNAYLFLNELREL